MSEKNMLYTENQECFCQVSKKKEETKKNSRCEVEKRKLKEEFGLEEKTW